MKRVLVFGIIVLILKEGSSTAEVESSSITGTLSEIDRLLTVNKRAERGRLLRLFQKLFQTFRKLYKRSYNPNESGGRFRQFVQAVKMILSVNKQGYEFKAEINKFTDMTDEEKSANTGVNASEYLMFAERGDGSGEDGTWANLQRRLKEGPDSLDWVAEGKTLRPLEQGDCASCWAMATIGAVEGRYAIVTGKLKRFSVQELVDCTYEYTGKDTGCNGGWFTKSYKYMKTSGHLTLASDLPYIANDGSCNAASLPNGFKAASLTAWKQERNPNFDQMVVAIQDGPVSVGIKAQGDFFQYGTGIYFNPTCSTDLNHGLVGVGYSPKYIILRNSWGYDWGQGGYVYFTRTHGNVCGVTSYMVYGTWTPNGGTDDDPDGIPESAAGVCRDLDPAECGEYGLIGCSDPVTSNFMKINCRFTCKICTVPEGDDDCPPGEVKCGAECKEEHLCEHHG